MFSSNGRDPFACRGVGCVKLPATAAFPTDDKLLQRIEEARRALPRNSVKPLWRVPQAENAAAVQRLRAARAELGSTLIRMEELYPHGRAAAG